MSCLRNDFVAFCFEIAIVVERQTNYVHSRNDAMNLLYQLFEVAKCDKIFV